MRELRPDFGLHLMPAQIALAQSQNQSLQDFLARFPARFAEPIPSEWYSMPIRAFKIIPVSLGIDGTAISVPDSPSPHPPVAPADKKGEAGHVHARTPDQLPSHLTDNEAVGRAYAREIHKIGRYLSANLSVLVVCDKILATPIYRHAVRYSNKQPLLENDSSLSHTNTGATVGESGLIDREVTSANVRIATIGRVLSHITIDQVLVLLHLDMLAGSSSGSLTTEARLLTEVLYRSSDFTPTLLGFTDPSIELPKVLTDRFAVHMELAGLCREAIPQLLTQHEYQRFDRFDQEVLFKNVSGFNALQMRNAMRYLDVSSQPATPTDHLMELIREFKRDSGEGVEIPDVTFDEIGGYAEVKQELFEAIELITGQRPHFNPDGSPYVPTDEDRYVPESEVARSHRRRLAPRGFIFYGPPGTGKTLFARAIANCMNATIQMVSGPEIMDMWVGKSESNLRHLFAVARHNAPAVIFFDEFDSIASQRTGFTDGGSRVSNGVVAQLLAEMDGFQPDQDILVIGTTNRLDIIDAALLRPSRFLPIEIGLPDPHARHHIARIHAKLFGIELPEPTLLDLVVEQTDGFSGDEIRAVFQGIARDIRRKKPVTSRSFEEHCTFIRKRHTSYEHSNT